MQSIFIKMYPSLPLISTLRCCQIMSSSNSLHIFPPPIFVCLFPFAHFTCYFLPYPFHSSFSPFILYFTTSSHLYVPLLFPFPRGFSLYFFHGFHQPFSCSFFHDPACHKHLSHSRKGKHTYTQQEECASKYYIMLHRTFAIVSIVCQQTIKRD